MPRSPSIVLDDTNRDVYLVLDDFGRLGRAWSETDEAGTSRATLVRNLLDGQYENPGPDRRLQHRRRLVA